MPSVLGLTQVAGRDLILAEIYSSGIADGDWYHRNPTVCSTEPAGTIIEQTPAAGSLIGRDDPTGAGRYYFRIAIAKACDPRPEMPSVLGLTQVAGRDLILAEIYSEGIADGDWYHRNPTVCSTETAGTIIEQTPAAGSLIGRDDPTGAGRYYFRIAIAITC